MILTVINVFCGFLSQEGLVGYLILYHSRIGISSYMYNIYIYSVYIYIYIVYTYIHQVCSYNIMLKHVLSFIYASPSPHRTPEPPLGWLQLPAELQLKFVSYS